MEERKIRVAITHGDTNGIGYEVILKAFEDPTMLELCTPIIYGSPKVATKHREALQLETKFNVIKSAADAAEGRLNLLAAMDDNTPVALGTPTAESAEAARKVMQRAKEDLKEGLYDVLVQAPVVGSNKPDREDRSLLVMFSENIRVALFTNHLPQEEVAQMLTKEQLVAKLTLLHTSLRRDFRISNPRIAVLALEGQTEAQVTDIIRPALEELESHGVQAFGPYQADEFFESGKNDNFDAVLAMTEEQGMRAFEQTARDYGVKMKTGFPFVITTTVHGPEFEQAGKGVADSTSLLHAIYSAIDIYRNRLDYDEPLANPLPKLFHEKREDGDKVRFAKLKGQIPPKHENG